MTPTAIVATPFAALGTLAGISAGGVTVAAVVLALVFVIAAALVGREAHRLDAQTPEPTLDLHEAVLWVADRLPDSVTAELSYDDVAQILDWHLEYLAREGLSDESEAGAGATSSGRTGTRAGKGNRAGRGNRAGKVGNSGDDAVVVDDTASVAFVVVRSRAAGIAYDEEHIRAVLDAHLGYLDEIGAIGPEADGIETAGP